MLIVLMEADCFKDVVLWNSESENTEDDSHESILGNMINVWGRLWKLKIPESARQVKS